MSILMDALKQQSAQPAARVDATAFWRKLALALALLVALLTGALLAYWLQPSRTAALPVAEPVQPAQPAQILAVLQDKAQPDVELQTAEAADTAALPTEKRLEVFAAEKPIPTVTAGSESLVSQNSAKGSQPVVTKAEQAGVEVSAELRDKFSAALKATEQAGATTAGSSGTMRPQSAPAKHISELDSATLQQIPALRFDAHVYATSATQRWVKVNGKTLQEGQWVTADIRIREITQQYVLLELGNQLFSIAALSEWPGN